MVLTGISRAVVGALLAISTLSMAAEAQAPGNASPLIGAWSGEYTCNQGRTGLTLTITRGTPDDVRALFHFYEAPSNPGVPTGCFEMEGSYDPGSGRVELLGRRWLLRPSNYVVVDFIGRLDAAAGRFEGRVEGFNCTRFQLVRQPSPRPVPPRCRPRPETIAGLEAPHLSSRAERSADPGPF